MTDEESAERKGTDGHMFSGRFWLDLLTAITSFLKVTLWPGLVVIFFLSYLEPIDRLLNQLPEKFSDATKVGFGGLYLEIGKQAAAEGNPELAERLGALSPEAIRQLLEIGRSNHIFAHSPSRGDGETYYAVPNKKVRTALRELSDASLISFRENLDDFMRWFDSDTFESVDARVSDFDEYRATRPLSDGERERLKRQSYALTSSGKQAWEIILEAILLQLEQADQPTALN